MIWVWSANGLGEMSRKLHIWARNFGMRDGHETRAVLLNNWEATGVNFDFNRIASLFAPAKEIAQRNYFCWMTAGSEINIRAASMTMPGWAISSPIIRACRTGSRRWPRRSAVKRGLRFGIWMEPEMVNPKSELYEQHPDWVIRQPKRELELQRNQLVLDLTRPAVQGFEWNTISNILSVPGISYAKVGLQSLPHPAGFLVSSTGPAVASLD